MLHQLQMLREAMYKGWYLFDTFRYRILQQESCSDQVADQLFALSKSSPSKHLCFFTRRMNMAFQGAGVKEVQNMLGRLYSIIDDVAEFIVFLKSYPPIIREPYNKFLEKCMFGRQAEMEKIISFLLLPVPPGVDSLQVLPIIGPPRVGKSTLVEHYCYDERVHDHFSSIILCSGNSAAIEDSGVVKLKTHGSHERSLVIMELADDLILDERQCKALYSSGGHLPPGSKVIITSRSENVVKLGTAGAMRLEFLPREAFWYFFKVMAFGSTNLDKHPELASAAMEIAAELDGSFVSANIFGGFLRANMQIRFWRKILGLERNQVERHIRFLGERPLTLLWENQGAYVWSLSDTSLRLKVLCYQTRSPQHDVLTTMLHEVQTRSAKAPGIMEVLCGNHACLRTTATL